MSSPPGPGGTWDLANLGRAFRRVLKAAELPHHVPYDLRHTYATSLLASGTAGAA